MTTYRTSKVQATDTDGEKITVRWDGTQRTVPFDYGTNNPHAEAVLRVSGEQVVHRDPAGDHRRGYRFVSGPGEYEWETYRDPGETRTYDHGDGSRTVVTRYAGQDPMFATVRHEGN